MWGFTRYFHDEDEYAEGFNFNQDGHYSKIIEKYNDKEESMTKKNQWQRRINDNQKLEQTYDQYVTEYSILQKCKFMLHTVQFKKDVVLDKSTRMVLKHQPTNRTYDSYKDM